MATNELREACYERHCGRYREKVIGRIRDGWVEEEAEIKTLGQGTTQ